MSDNKGTANKSKRTWTRRPPRSEAPPCDEGEMLVRDALTNLADCDVFQTVTHLNENEKLTVKGSKSQWRVCLSKRGANDKIRATYRDGVFVIGG